MQHTIINNLFELWALIGHKNNNLNDLEHYSYSKFNNTTWPSKIFNLKPNTDFKKLYTAIKLARVPNSIALLENKTIEALLLKHIFILKSTVKGMYLNLTKENKPENNFNAIEKVDSIEKATEFANLASLAFGYDILPSTIIALLHNTKLKLYLGKHNEQFGSCGLILLDQNNISGIHMIGTIPEYRGLGLGKIMTNKLVFEAFKNKSNQAVLVASQSGELIYKKLGFITNGNLKNYMI